jgi:2-polyprenyl-6-hydroxyphenyl methylase / 3-demethylubiquinone-9 3-methyltransferase
MAKASTASAFNPSPAAAAHPAATINPAEAAHFGALAADWWDPKGSSAMLHRLNPVRLGYIREQIDAHWHGDARARRPLEGKTAIDVGCGAGLLCEPLARMGAMVTGVDAAPENIAAARAHSTPQNLSIRYHAGEIAGVQGQYDLVTAMEVIEHVSHPQAFVAALVARLAPGGLMILSTPNRTPLSRMGLITIGEGFGSIPKGTHDWNQFLTPEELTEMLESAGLRVMDTRGIALSPTRGLMLSDDLRLNYLMTAVAA